MKDFIRRNTIVILLSITGAIAGFLYWKYVGCLSGTCVIKSVWYLSTLYGLGLGWVLGGLVQELILSLKNKKNYE